MSQSVESLARAAATTDQVRRANLAHVLALVHRSGPVSRADLTRLTGLNRSTVGDLVVELTELGLVFEAAPTGINPPGRPSPIVHADPRVVAIAINPEVDAIHIGLVGLSGRIVAKVRLETGHAPTPREVVAMASAAIAGLLSNRELRVAGVGIAVPGQVRLSDGSVSEATHMGWTDEPISALIAESTGFPTWAANAANLGMRAESAFGVGRGIDDFVYFIGGASGIGGGAVVGGEQLTGATGYAGEFGHAFVRSDGALCPCGASGCLEAEVTQARLLDAVGLVPAEADQLAARLARSSDPAVRTLIAEQIGLLGIAVRTTVNLFNPSLVVLGGFLADLYVAAGSDSGALVAEAIRSSRGSVRIERAALGSEQLMIGAGELVFAQLIASPGALASVDVASVTP
jgi:predicted NBD/HSP70 family sugar kinase